MLDLSNLKLSISNLWQEFGHTQNWIVAFIINGATIAIGLTMYYYLTQIDHAAAQFTGYAGAAVAAMAAISTIHGVLHGS